MNLPSLGANYIDLIIAVVLVYFASEAIRHGFWVILADFAAFLGSLVISLRTYKFGAEILRSNFSLPHSVANALGFLVSAIVIEGVLGFVLAHLIVRIPKKYWKGRLNKVLAVIPALGEGLVLIAFLLTLALGLPIKPSLKTDIAKSKIGSLILNKTSNVETAINEVFGGVIEDSLTYLTVKPGSRERITLNSVVGTLKDDEKSESEMFSLVNAERAKNGVAPLAWSVEIVGGARKHAADMWVRHYFGHVSPEGDDVGDRLNKARIDYGFAGENLALAPTVVTAMNGLLNSPGHRANILEAKFKKVGIGVIDNGFYGKMFVQVFSD